MQKYKIEDLVEGRIVDFKSNNRYGIIVNEGRGSTAWLTCVYSDGGFDELDTIMKREFELYSSIYPIRAFAYMRGDEMDPRVKTQLLSLIPPTLPTKKKTIIKMQDLAHLFGIDVDDFEVVD